MICCRGGSAWGGCVGGTMAPLRPLDDEFSDRLVSVTQVYPRDGSHLPPLRLL